MAKHTICGRRFRHDGLTTTCTLIAEFPNFIDGCPADAMEWALRHPSVHVRPKTSRVLRATVRKSTTPKFPDPYRRELGEKIAEAKATKTLYRFLYTLARKAQKPLSRKFWECMNISEHYRSLWLDELKYFNDNYVDDFNRQGSPEP